MSATAKPLSQDSEPLATDPREEIDWLRGIANGDRGSFRHLHERFQRLVFSTVYKVLGNTEDTGDVCQDVFARIWNKAQMFDATKGKPITWVTTMARNRAIDFYRSKVRRFRSVDRFTDHVEVTAGEGSVDTEQDIARNETSHILQSAVLELTPDQREVIELAYFKGLTQHEVAETIQQPLGTVKGRIRRGIQRLEKKVRCKL